MIELCGMTPEEITLYMKTLGQGAFRGAQVYAWAMKGVPVEEMTNLSKDLREKIAQQAVTNPVKIREERVSKLDGTRKYLFELADGNLIEGVLMRYKYGCTLCVSTQVGCKMGCVFCASTLEGCARNLTPGELVGQVLCANKVLEASGERVHNLVLMGSGEPFDNYDNVVKFLRLVIDERGLNLSVRSISLSTCGLVERMRAFAEEGLPITLSLSLHAPNDRIRKKLMPVAQAYTMEKTLAACKNYVEKTGRRVIFEYAMAEGINCDIACADELASRLRGLQCHVNLIPLNAVEERGMRPPDEKTVDAFLHRLEILHISVTKRREMGDDIAGACGQLRRGVIGSR
ncbi:MAG: 23S rRNA (adenine(2503)-C(2))-methyltransferase RlmN [Clostridia bacterium]